MEYRELLARLSSIPYHRSVILLFSMSLLLVLMMALPKILLGVGSKFIILKHILWGAFLLTILASIVILVKFIPYLFWQRGSLKRYFAMQSYIGMVMAIAVVLVVVLMYLITVSPYVLMTLLIFPFLIPFLLSIVQVTLFTVWFGILEGNYVVALVSEGVGTLTIYILLRIMYAKIFFSFPFITTP